MNKRFLALFFLFGIIFVGLSGKTFYEQIINGPAYLQKSLSSRTINFPAEEYLRGDILDRNGISLTDSMIRPTIVIFPKLIQNPSEVITKIQAISLKSIEPYMRKNVKIYPKPFLIHLNQDNIELLKVVQEIKTPGVSILPIKTRYGPNSMAEHIVGYIGYPDNGVEQRGLKGIERLYDQELQGNSAERIITPIVDARNNILAGLGYRNINLNKDFTRQDVFLTIDSRIQKLSENVLDSHGIIQGAAVVLEIETGDILAAVTRPSFNQKKPAENWGYFNNQLERVIDYKVYPGSIFKLITAVAALEEGIVSPNHSFFCHGLSDDFHVTCPHPHGAISFTEAMMKSCNVVFVQLGLELGRDKLEEYMIDKFGFLPVKNKALDSRKARANAVIGQEVFMTSPLEVANMMATIARGGLHQKLNNPWQTRLVYSIGPTGEGQKVFPKQQFQQIFSAKTAQSLQRMLIATNQTGSGHRAWIEGYGSAGKTGTSQSGVTNEYCAWYAGYAPLENPRYALVILVEEKAYTSKSVLQGGINAAPLFKEIMEGIFELEKR